MNLLIVASCSHKHLLKFNLSQITSSPDRHTLSFKKINCFLIVVRGFYLCWKSTECHDFFRNTRWTGQSQTSPSALANGSRMWTLPEPPAAGSQDAETPVPWQSLWVTRVFVLLIQCLGVFLCLWPRRACCTVLHSPREMWFLLAPGRLLDINPRSVAGLPSSFSEPPAGRDLVIPLALANIQLGFRLQAGWLVFADSCHAFCIMTLSFRLPSSIQSPPTPTHVNLSPESLEGWVGRHTGALPWNSHDCFSVLTLRQGPWSCDL